jgi:hypothetical protein
MTAVRGVPKTLGSGQVKQLQSLVQLDRKVGRAGRSVLPESIKTSSFTSVKALPVLAEARESQTLGAGPVVFLTMRRVRINRVRS